MRGRSAAHFSGSCYGVGMWSLGVAVAEGAAARGLILLSTPTLRDYDLTADTANLCVSLPSPVAVVTIVGGSALALGAALFLAGKLLQRRADRLRAARFGPH